MRTVSFVERLEFEYQGNIFSSAITLGDIDNDKVNHLLRKRENLVKSCNIALFVCLCFTSLQQRGHLDTVPPFTVPCEGREAR